MTVMANASMLIGGMPHPGTDVPELFRTNLGVIERAIERVCRRSGLQGADAEDFASEAKLALIENDYEVLRNYRGESALSTFVTIVIQNFLTDSRERMLGRFRPSAEAKRTGRAAVLLEQLVVRDGRPLEQVLPIVGLTRAEAVAILERLPLRESRPRAVELDAIESEEPPSARSADERVRSAEAQRVSAATSRVIRATLGRMPLEDRMIVRLRYVSGMSIADISRMIRLPQRPLYRRIERVLEQLRDALVAAGLDASSVADLIGDASTEMDFGLEVQS